MDSLGGTPSSMWSLHSKKIAYLRPIMLISTVRMTSC